MRISPVSMAHTRHNSRPQNQSPSFGKFENTEVAQHVKENMLNPDKHGAPAKVAFDYLDKSDLVTIKSKKGLVYAVAERDAISKHENKELLERAILRYYRCTFSRDKKELTATLDNTYRAFEWEDEFEEQTKIIKSEPNYLTLVDDFGDAHNLYVGFRDAENGYDPTAPSSDSTPLRERYEPDSWDKAHDWMKN